MNNTTESIVLTPNYEGLFKGMLHEAAIQAEAQRLFHSLGDEQRAEALRAVQRFLAPLNIAAQCMTNREAVEKFREALNQMVQDIDRTASQLEDRDPGGSASVRVFQDLAQRKDQTNE